MRKVFARYSQKLNFDNLSPEEKLIYAIIKHTVQDYKRGNNEAKDFLFGPGLKKFFSYFGLDIDSNRFLKLLKGGDTEMRRVLATKLKFKQQENLADLESICYVCGRDKNSSHLYQIKDKDKISAGSLEVPLYDIKYKLGKGKEGKEITYRVCADCCLLFGLRPAKEFKVLYLYL